MDAATAEEQSKQAVASAAITADAVIKAPNMTAQDTIRIMHMLADPAVQPILREACAPLDRAQFDDKDHRTDNKDLVVDGRCVQ